MQEIVPTEPRILSMDNNSNDDIDEVLDELDTTVAPSRCTEHDVILGRGRAINNWPGNIYFRKLALKYRDEYSKSNRYQKVEVALQLMDEIAAMGGRFVRVDNFSWNYNNNNDYDNGGSGFDCYEVDEARAIEKTCQALRDRHYDRHFVQIQQQQQQQQQQSAEMSIHLAQSTDSDCVIPGRNHIESTLNTCGADHENNETATKGCHDDDYSTSTGRQRSARHKHQHNLFDTDEMLRRLRIFQSTYNHTSVPPDWEQDVVLADWCTVQRQLYRQYQSGYERTNGSNRHPNTVHETRVKIQVHLFETLQTMDFCWDYDEWHWNYWFDQLMTVSEVKPLQKPVNVWLQQQRKQYRNGTMTHDRSERLKQAGYLPNA